MNNNRVTTSQCFQFLLNLLCVCIGTILDLYLFQIWFHCVGYWQYRLHVYVELFLAVWTIPLSLPTRSICRRWPTTVGLIISIINGLLSKTFFILMDSFTPHYKYSPFGTSYALTWDWKTIASLFWPCLKTGMF